MLIRGYRQLPRFAPENQVQVTAEIVNQHVLNNTNGSVSEKWMNTAVYMQTDT